MNRFDGCPHPLVAKYRGRIHQRHTLCPLCTLVSLEPHGRRDKIARESLESLESTVPSKPLNPLIALESLESTHPLISHKSLSACHRTRGYPSLESLSTLVTRGRNPLEPHLLDPHHSVVPCRTLHPLDALQSYPTKNTPLNTLGARIRLQSLDPLDSFSTTSLDPQFTRHPLDTHDALQTLYSLITGNSLDSDITQKSLKPILSLNTLRSLMPPHAFFSL